MKYELGSAGITACHERRRREQTARDTFKIELKRNSSSELAHALQAGRLRSRDLTCYERDSNLECGVGRGVDFGD